MTNTLNFFPGESQHIKHNPVTKQKVTYYNMELIKHIKPLLYRELEMLFTDDESGLHILVY